MADLGTIAVLGDPEVQRAGPQSTTARPIPAMPGDPDAGKIVSQAPIGLVAVPLGDPEEKRVGPQTVTVQPSLELQLGDPELQGRPNQIGCSGSGVSTGQVTFNAIVGISCSGTGSSSDTLVEGGIGGAVLADRWFAVAFCDSWGTAHLVGIVGIKAEGIGETFDLVALSGLGDLFADLSGGSSLGSVILAPIAGMAAQGNGEAIGWVHMWQGLQPTAAQFWERRVSAIQPRTRIPKF